MRSPSDYEKVASKLDAAMACSAQEVLLVNGAHLTPEPVRWLWRDWLAQGKFHILAGAPGQGKTTIAISMAATVTSGGCWPDGSRCEPGNVLIWSGEDDHADTLLPRLLAAGANRDRCYFVSGTRVGGQIQSFDPARHMALMEEAIANCGGMKLLIIDPVVSVVTGNSHQNTEVRRDLQPVVNLAARLGAAVLGISHLSKGGQGSDPVSRVVGSIAFAAVARVVLLAGKVSGEGAEDRRVLARGKSNIGPDDGGFDYSLAQATPLLGIEASYIAWGAAVKGNARDIFAESSDDQPASSAASAVDEATSFLREVLKDGPSPTKYVSTEAKEAGLSWRTVRRASDDMGVIKRRGHEGTWYWEYPNLSNQLAQSVQPQNLGQLGQVGQLEKVEAPGHAAPADLDDSTHMNLEEF